MIIKFDIIDDHEIDGLSQGYLTVMGSKGILCSKRKPSMILIAIPLFLKGVVTLLTTSTRAAEFPAIDSSFQLNMSKFNKKRVRVYHGKVLLDEVTNEELVKCAWGAVCDLLARYPQITGIRDDYDTAKAIDAACSSFKAMFSDILCGEVSE